MLHAFHPILEFMKICLWDFLLVCQSQAYYTFWKHFLKNSTTIILRTKYQYELKAGIAGILLYFGMFGDMNLRCSIFEPKSKFFDFFFVSGYYLKTVGSTHGMMQSDCLSSKA